MIIWSLHSQESREWSQSGGPTPPPPLVPPMPPPLLPPVIASAAQAFPSPTEPGSPTQEADDDPFGLFAAGFLGPGRGHMSIDVKPGVPGVLSTRKMRSTNPLRRSSGWTRRSAAAARTEGGGDLPEASGSGKQCSSPRSEAAQHCLLSPGSIVS